MIYMIYDGYDLYGFSYEGAKTEKVYFDEYFASVDKSLEAIFPDHEVRIRDWSDDLTRFLFSVSSDKDPGSTYLFDLSKGKVSLISESAPWIKNYQLASMEPFTYMSRDGIKLHGYITLPPTYEEGDKIPFIIHPHGGPNARDIGDITQRFNSMQLVVMELYKWTIEVRLVMEERK